jgi:hypothetical protein
MDDAMKIRDLNFKVICLQNGLRIEKGQALVAYKENNDLKIEVDRLKFKQLKAEDLIAELHEQVYDNSHLDKQVELYFYPKGSRQ